MLAIKPMRIRARARNSESEIAIVHILESCWEMCARIRDKSTSPTTEFEFGTFVIRRGIRLHISSEGFPKYKN